MLGQAWQTTNLRQWCWINKRGQHYELWNSSSIVYGFETRSRQSISPHTLCQRHRRRHHSVLSLISKGQPVLRPVLVELEPPFLSVQHVRTRSTTKQFLTTLCNVSLTQSWSNIDEWLCYIKMLSVKLYHCLTFSKINFKCFY